MLLDHIGYIFFPGQIWIRCIGRLSMPLFAYGIANGFNACKQKNSLTKYVIRLIIFAIISQVPYILIFGNSLNIGFTWILSLMVLYLWDKSHNYILMILLCFAIYLFDLYIPFDYGLYGVLMPLIFYEFLVKNYLPKNIVIGVFALWCLYLITYVPTQYQWVQLMSIFSIPLILCLRNVDRYISLPKWFSYGFYPIHILLLFIMKMALQH